MADVALVPQSDVFQASLRIPANQPGQAAEILRGNRIALMGHRRGSLLTLRKRFFNLKHFRSLQMADLGGDPLDAGGYDGQVAHEFRMAVPRNHLRRYRLSL